MREETFGPFLPIMAVDSDDQAVQLANDSKYGLAGSVWTRDVEAGRAIARRLRVGSVMIKDEALCIRCGYCALRCPTAAVTMEHFSYEDKYCWK